MVSAPASSPFAVNSVRRARMRACTVSFVAWGLVRGLRERGWRPASPSAAYLVKSSWTHWRPMP